jgi:hypothetical protein
VNGDQLPERTRVWVSNDTKNIYFAFYCHDSQPCLVKSSVTKHDNIWQDDWIGFNLDPLGNKSYGYVLVINPLGIQADLFDSPGTGADDSPDYVWYSAGKILEDGYSVEIQVPLKNFTHSSGENVEMNIIFERKVQRLGLAASWPAVPVGQSFFAGMCKFIFPKIESQLKLQTIPSVTYNSSWDRVTPGSWSEGNGKTEFGITAKYGLTSTISAEATYNPDFSHVESDAFQVQINQRYPIYYSEKRPFFMEAGNFLDISSGSLGYPNLLSAVHTRRIVNPIWGGKIMGESKGLLFGILAAGDEWPGREFKLPIDEGDKNPFEGKIAAYLIGRLKYILSGENHLGMIITDREFAGGYNRVIGGDLNLRLGKGNHLVIANVLNSFSKNENNLKKSNGLAGNLAYTYITRAFEFYGDYEYIDTEFDMSTAFIRRTGSSKLGSMLRYNLYPQNENLQWIKKIYPIVWGSIEKDLRTKEYDYAYKGGVNFNFTKQGSLRFEYQKFQEFWAGKILKGGFFNSFGEIQLTNWLRIYAQINFGDRIHYSLNDPFVGGGITTNVELTIQPNKNLSQFFRHQYQDLYRKDNDEKVYHINIFISNTTYQISRYLFLRAILQYDSYMETVLVDALASYELIPGTVLQMGYGSLYKNVCWMNNQWENESPLKEYYNFNQSIFLKVSYLFQY